jgi:hypothetical protein
MNTVESRMNTINGLLLRAVFLIMILRIPSFSQESYDPQGTVYNQIAPLIQGKYGQGYDFSYTMFDTAVYYSEDDNIQDPYGTLKGCVLFSAYKFDSLNYTPPDTFIVGMIKNGQIIWDDFPGSGRNLSDDHFYGTLLYSQDINSDGEVDLVFANARWNSLGDREAAIVYIEILSWNGTSGRFVSGDMIGSGGVDLLDVDGSGIKCLRAKLLTQDEISLDMFKTSTFPYVTYGWNGTQYGLWPSVRQIPIDELLPANRFQATVTCRISMEDGAYEYLYSVSNHSESEQKIESFYISSARNIISKFAPIGWSKGTSRTTGGPFFDVDLNKRRFMIKPGSSINGFMTKSATLPAIVRYYLLGYNGTVCCGHLEQYSQYIYNYSLAGFTLGTRDTTTTIGASQWPDTLIGYVTQSRALGWIKDQPTADKYLSYFSSVRAQLVQGDSVGARAVLQQVLRDVDIDSTTNLTSEAYALLRYNTEYLVDKLRQK